MNDANNPALSSESVRIEAAPVLHWGVSVALLSLACAAAAWVSAMGATWGDCRSKGEPIAIRKQQHKYAPN